MAYSTSVRMELKKFVRVCDITALVKILIYHTFYKCHVFLIGQLNCH